ncbi:hypothetical protein N7451_002891 [Penicillium sp. IBT 35674x]|nr:hypothetical protein N7451_002891 [Penicillium sp. IBT 35674x]
MPERDHLHEMTHTLRRRLVPTLVRLPKDSSVAAEAWRSLEAQREQIMVFHAQRPVCASTDLQWLHGSERESYAY